jgi:predicted ATP-dependent endonuclease of OLD family
MAPIEKLVIDGYRGIDHFEYEPKMINILVGRNNTGKSSILEVAAITYTAPTGFQDRLGNNIFEKIIERKGWENLEYFINLNKKDKELKLKAVKNETEISVSATYKERNKEVTEHAVIDLVAEYYDKLYGYMYLENVLRRSLKSIEETPKEKVTKAIRGTILFGQISPSNNYFVALPDDKKILMRVSITSDLIFYCHQFEEKFDIKYLHDILLPTAKMHQSLSYLRRHMPYFNDLRSDGQKIWIYFENLQQPLPLSMIGDGMRETIRLLFIASLIQGGVLLIEEPENNLHPGLYEVVAERLVEVARQDRTQVFLSTHNLEFAEKLLRSGEELVNVVRLYRVKDELAYEVLSHGEALEELDELRIDLRGP